MAHLFRQAHDVVVQMVKREELEDPCEGLFVAILPWVYLLIFSEREISPASCSRTRDVTSGHRAWRVAFDWPAGE
jgi:hypothetical protein